MAISKRKFTLEFKVDAAHRVIDSGRSVREVAQELSIERSTLSRWVRDERRRAEAIDTATGLPLETADRNELNRIRREIAELQKDNAFLGKAAAYFAQTPPKRRDSL